MSVPERMRTYSSAFAAVRVKRGSTTIIRAPVSFACSMCSIDTGCASAAFAADVHRALGVLHVVVRIGHRAVAPGVGYAGDRGRVADPRLVVAVVRAPERHELAHQVRLLVAVLRAADPEHRVGARFLAQREQLVADLVDRLVPADLLVLAVDELHRRLEPVLAVAVLAHRRALGAMRAEVERRIEHRVLPRPHAVLDGGVDGAADRAVRADGALHLGLGCRRLPSAPRPCRWRRRASWLANAPAPATRPERFKNVRRSIVGSCAPTRRRRRGPAADSSDRSSLSAA